VFVRDKGEFIFTIVVLALILVITVVFLRVLRSRDANPSAKPAVAPSGSHSLPPASKLLSEIGIAEFGHWRLRPSAGQKLG
jgi:hypothetical protein